MKKLMIAAAIVCAAAMAQAGAARWNWTTTGNAAANIIYAAGTTSPLYSEDRPVSFYLFDAAIYSQTDLLTGLRDENKSITDFTAAYTTTLTPASQILEKGTLVAPDGQTKYFEYGESGKDYKFFMAALVDDKVLITDTTGQLGGSETDPIAANFAQPARWSGSDYGDAAWTKGNQGWYAVPEPTSGLLLLLGVAGLALRRRRA